MSPGVKDEGFPRQPHDQHALGLAEANGLGNEDSYSHVIVAGAGPAGLMLAYVLLGAHWKRFY